MATKKSVAARDREYNEVFDDVAELLEASRAAAVRTVNALMTSTYWLIGRRIFEGEQRGKGRADYGEQLVERLGRDLTSRFGRGFGRRNLFLMRSFFVEYREIVQAVPAQSGVEGIVQALPALSGLMARLSQAFPLPWTHYVRLLAVRSNSARRFYETEALRGGWSSRQLDRQIQSQFYERTALSKNKVRMLARGEVAEPGDAVAPEEAIKEPFVLEFLNLKDEYSENDLEEALIKKLETFLMELGGAFTFVGRQRRLRVGDE